MAVTRRGFLSALTAASAVTALAACKRGQEQAPSATTETAPKVDLGEFKSLELDMRAWHYDAEHEVWWQVGLPYCTKPVSSSNEKLGIYVPGAYLKPTDEKANLKEADASATFECELNAEGTAGAYTCATAPVVMPINCPEFQAQTAPTAYLYDGLEPYLSAGLVYVYAGCRGRSSGYDSSSEGEGFYSGGAPWGIADLKAAVRYLRYNASRLPGSTDRIVTFGQAAGGLLSALMGATGNAPAYDAYLAEIGAATHDGEQGETLGDDIHAAMCWCPEPSASVADAAYEWELGQFVEADTRAEGTWTKLLSCDLAAAYATHVNNLALTAEGGSTLALDETAGGVFNDGSYYEELAALVEASAAQFLNETAFPYTAAKNETLSGQFPGSGVKAVEAVVDLPPSADEAATDDAAAEDGETGDEGTSYASAAAGKPVTNSTTYASRSDYVAALNEGGRWITYNERRGTVRISGLGGYVRACRGELSPVLSYDAEKRSSATNLLFGNDDNGSLHFSKEVSDLLAAGADTYAQQEGFDPGLPEAWAQDLAETDAIGQSMAARCNMYDPLCFVSAAGEGFGTAAVAPRWRINVGLFCSKAPVSTSYNLARALKAYDGVEDVSFTAVWGEGNTLAEPAQADPAQAFTSWVASICPGAQGDN